MASAQGAMGGGALVNLSSMKRVDSLGLSLSGMNLAATVTSQVVYPDRYRADIMLPFGEMVQAVDGETAWSKSPEGIQDIGGKDAEDMRLGILEDPQYLLGHFDQFQLQSLDPETVGETETQVVLIWISDEKWMKLYFDAVSSVLVKSDSMAKHMMTQALGLQETFYENPKDFGGIIFAQKSRTTHDGEELMSAEVQSVEINPTVDASVFAKPQS